MGSYESIRTSEHEASLYDKNERDHFVLPFYSYRILFNKKTKKRISRTVKK